MDGLIYQEGLKYGSIKIFSKDKYERR